ncbi:hypothetical protein WICPIJ_009509 [Wickerhamomyces pijperi]|uniref:Uncharacterized protein n=1 Tax=Wickerhamomyces pijperi TaxID=599730 RepID=A0A9P8PNF0_WICPI|nr:hypothetical protein WICPIJ_009509 [Wickerhamomyces pijperi]
MLIALTSDQLCPSSIVHEIFKRSEIVSTAESFKSWNTCMDNKTCKIVAIVGIVVASIVLFGFIGFLIRCFCCGVQGIGEILCCCCSCCGAAERHHQEKREPPKSAYDNPFMYPPPSQQYNPNYQPHMNYAPVSQPQFHYGPGVVSDEANHGQQNGYQAHEQAYGYGQAGGHNYRGQFV